MTRVSDCLSDGGLGGKRMGRNGKFMFTDMFLSSLDLSISQAATVVCHIMISIVV